jgi:biotin transporter BioY
LLSLWHSGVFQGDILEHFSISWLAILAAVIIKQALGALWFSPALFGPSWCKLTGVSKADVKAGLVKALIPDVIGSALMAFVLVHAVHYAGAQGWAAGAAVWQFDPAPTAGSSLHCPVR